MGRGGFAQPGSMGMSGGPGMGGMGGPGMGGGMGGGPGMGGMGGMPSMGGGMGGGAGMSGGPGMGAGGTMGGVASGALMGVASGGSGIEPLSRSIFIRKLPPTVTLEALVNEVGVYGPIESFRIDYERHEAFVNFVDGHHAQTLLEEKPTISFAGGGGVPSELTWGKKKAMAVSPTAVTTRSRVNRMGFCSVSLASLPACLSFVPPLCQPIR